MRKMAKGIISIVLAIIMAISVIPTDIYAADETSSTESQSIASGTCGDNLNWEVTADYKMVISGSGDMYDYWNKNVDKELILAPWAEYASDIREIVIGDAVTKIGRYAFCDFTSLTEVTIPNNVTYVGKAAFNGATALEEMTLPFVGQGEGAKSNSQTGLLGYMFSPTEYEGSVKCTQTSSDRNNFYTAYLPASLKKVTVTGPTLLAGAFSGCTALEEVILSGDVSQIMSRTFENCTNLKEFTIPKSVSAVDLYAFSGCESMKSFTILSDFTCKDTSFDSDYVESIYISCDVYDLYYDKTTSQWL
ncbi:MAG: leucine-rich repeat domain-containing protein, partial [Lachnospiraceae bacterium]|nr:leucine-rich repeat domain-containing protein [Lachnospiraceae bacterium]